MSSFKSWLTQPDQFDWISGILRDRGLLRSARWILAVVTSASVLVPVSALIGTRRATAAVVLVNVTAAIFIVGVSVFWLLRWPTRVQSEIFGVVAAAFIGGWSLTQSVGALAALGCCAMAINGGYIALFHSNKLLVFNIIVALTVAALAAVHLARETSIGTAVVAFWVTWMLNLSCPLVMRGMSRAVGTYAVRADEDALTGLFNRRGFIAALTRRLADLRVEEAHLILLMVDLDAFKRVNDTFGHAAGDRALIAVADLLRQNMAPTAVLCRAGGEEFLIAVVSPSPTAAVISARLGSAIAALPHRITASIGTATAALWPTRTCGLPGFIDKLIDMADTAMYVAKRRGGNQAYHL